MSLRALPVVTGDVLVEIRSADHRQTGMGLHARHGVGHDGSRPGGLERGLQGAQFGDHREQGKHRRAAQQAPAAQLPNGFSGVVVHGRA